MIPSDIRCCANGCNHDQENDKSDFYYCLTCSNMLGTTKSYCTKCISIHDEDHIKVNFEKKNFYCKNHFQKFIKYCFDCKKIYVKNVKMSIQNMKLKVMNLCHQMKLNYKN